MLPCPIRRCPTAAATTCCSLPLTPHPHMPLNSLQASFSLTVLEDGPVDAFCGWFDTQFKGSQENPVTTEVTLTTAPDPTGATHWGQQVRTLPLPQMPAV